VDEAVNELQRDWEVIRYQTPVSEREKRFEQLAAKAHKPAKPMPGRAEPLVWEGIIVSSWAGEKGGLGALGLVKQAKALYERPSRSTARPGRLGLQQPGRAVLQGARLAVGFGDKAKARDLLQKALAINPKGIDANFFFAEYLVETKHPEDAAAYLERALQAPGRAGRQIADAGRREEARLLLDKAPPFPLASAWPWRWCSFSSRCAGRST
jgi:tetratricopeptide (TPR) repeat protein